MNKFHAGRPPAVPGPRGLPLVGNGLTARKDALGFFQQVIRTYGDVARVRLGPQTMYLVNHPTYLKAILRDRANHYGKNNAMYEAMSTFFGEATAIVDGERWRQGFNLIQPVFNRAAVEASVPKILEGVDGLVARWRGVQGPRDVLGDVSRMTLNIIVRQMFGSRLGDEEAEVSACFHWLTDFVAERMLSPVKIPLAWPTPMHQEFRRTLARLDEVWDPLESTCRHASLSIL